MKAPEVIPDVTLKLFPISCIEFKGCKILYTERNIFTVPSKSFR